MRPIRRMASLAAAWLLCLAPLMAAEITGDYVETRSADVYTGPCVANAEVGLTGDSATLAWRVRQGKWNGVGLDGLSVVAVARASATLGDPFADPYPARSILIIDAHATEDQKCALADFAQTMGGRLLEHVVAVQSAPISLEVGGHEAHGVVEMRAGTLARIQTRAIGDKDHLCGNEVTYYPPLTGRLTHAMPAFTVADEFQGPGLGLAWKVFGKRSAFVGTFER